VRAHRRGGCERRARVWGSRETYQPRSILWRTAPGAQTYRKRSDRRRSRSSTPRASRSI
jgi:hypothetical protein